MQQSNVWHSLRQEGGVPELLRTRTRTRRKRRKRSWAAPWAYLLPLFLSCGTFWTSPALVSLAIFFTGNMAGLQNTFVSLHAATDVANRLLR
jgi:ABC-type sugar transport system permease subunit